MDSELSGLDALLGRALRDQAARELAGFAVGDWPADHVAAEGAEEQVEVGKARSWCRLGSRSGGRRPVITALALSSVASAKSSTLTWPWKWMHGGLASAAV